MLFKPIILGFIVVGVGMMLCGVFLALEGKRMKEGREPERKDENSEQ